MKDKKEKKKTKIKIEHLPFLGTIFLFAGFSMYGILSFNLSLGNIADQMKASVIMDGVLVSDATVSQGAFNHNLYALDSYSGEEVFSDVLGSHPNSVAVAYFKQNGWVGGYENGSFKPDQPINRAELLTILTNLADVDFTSGVYENCFKDVKNEWFAPYVCYAKENGWVGGYGDGSYRPGQTVNKSECLKIAIDSVNTVVGVDIALPAFVTEKPYADVEVTEWYAPYAKVALDGGIVSGNLFFPLTSMTRGEFVQMVYGVLSYANVVR